MDLDTAEERIRALEDAVLELQDIVDILAGERNEREQAKLPKSEDDTESQP